MTLDEFFAGRDDSRQLFDVLRIAIEAIGPVQLRTGKSQVSFRRRRAFAWVWIPARYLRGKHAPLVLTISLNRRDTSDRWKETVGPLSGRFTHLLELQALSDIDAEVAGWLREAWEAAA